MGDYGFRSEVEPRISKTESFILREVIAKSENNLEEAIVYLEEKIENDSTYLHDPYYTSHISIDFLRESRGLLFFEINS